MILSYNRNDINIILSYLLLSFHIHQMILRIQMKFNKLGYRINIEKENITDADARAEIEKALAILEKYSVSDQISAMRAKSVAKATKVRQDTAKRKIEDAVNLLRLENRNISEYAVAKKSGCSINTVKKYREFIRSQK